MNTETDDFYEVVNAHVYETVGEFDTLDEAQGCADTNRLDNYTIFKGSVLMGGKGPEYEAALERQAEIRRRFLDFVAKTTVKNGTYDEF